MIIPLSTAAEVNSSKCLGSTYGSVDKHLLIDSWVWTIERRRPRTTNGHWLILASKSDQELNQPGWMLERLS